MESSNLLSSRQWRSSPLLLASPFADFDGNGTEDLFLAQNFFGVHPEAVRCDAGRSVLLLGDSHGGFEAAPGSASGLPIYGEGRVVGPRGRPEWRGNEASVLSATWARAPGFSR